MGLVRRLGQICLAAMFIKLGGDAAREPGRRPVKVADAGIPEPELAVRANGAAMIVGGLALALNRWPRLAALGLAGVMIATTLVGHAFWKDEDAAARKGNVIQFLKNLGLIGGLLVIVSGQAGKANPSE